jgi:hypothetical protein
MEGAWLTRQTKPQLRGGLTCGYVVARGGVEPLTFRFSDVRIQAGQRAANVNRTIELARGEPSTRFDPMTADRGDRSPRPENNRQGRHREHSREQRASVVFRPPERADEGDMPRLAGRRVHQASPGSRERVRLG